MYVFFWHSEENESWRASIQTGGMDSFFAGNHLSLVCVNTRPVMNGRPVGVFPAWKALLRWFRAAELVSNSEMETFVRQCDKRVKAETCLYVLKTFREGVRATVFRLEAGEEPPSKTVTEFNQLPRAHPLVLDLRRGAGRLARRKPFALRRPDNLMAPIVDAAADMLLELKPARVRQCENCILQTGPSPSLQKTTLYHTQASGNRRDDEPSFALFGRRSGPRLGTALGMPCSVACIAIP